MMSPPIAFTGIFRISVLLVLAMPLLSAVVCLLLPARRPRWVMTMASMFLFVGLLAAGMLFSYNIGGGQYGFLSFTWFELGGHTIDINIWLNERAVRMILLVMLVSWLVHVYSVAYMAGDAALKRYYAALGFFTFSMLGIVLTENMLVMFVFWELVGFSSYMLIGHWRDRPAAAAAAKKAFVMNRIGDAGFIIGLMIFWAGVGTLNYVEVGYVYPDSYWKTAGALCIFCGVIGKSAQFPLFTWLPDAMEGPTPASALIHAATMVAAGVFVLVQMYGLFTPASFDVIAVVGLITAVLAALAALAQTDLKKILAYSTVSQLGFMVMAVGAGAPEAAFLHLFTHGFFKACLFLCAGAVIHALHEAQHGTHNHFDVQDIRNLGGLWRKLPFTFAAFAISGAALAGLPFFSGFLSKDAILTALLYWKGDAFSWRYIVFGGAFLVSFLTALYTFRLIATVFLGNEQKTAGLTVHEPSWYMRAPIALLALGSGWFLVSWNPLNYHGWLYLPMKADENFHSTILVFVSAAWVLIACAVGYFLYSRRYTQQSAVLQQAFYVDKVYVWVATKPVLALAFFTEKIDRRYIDVFLHYVAYSQVTLAHLTGFFDRVIIDGAVNGMAALVRTIGSFTRSFQGGKIQLYIFWSVLAIIIFLIWTLL